MGTYPEQYSKAAIMIAEDIVHQAVQGRLVNDGWKWSAEPFLLSSLQLQAIRLRFEPDVSDETLLRFIGLVFSKIEPTIHYHFTSDGYLLGIGGSEYDPTIVVEELPECFHGYTASWRQDSYKAALDATHALVVWTLTSYRERKREHNTMWPVGEWGGADLIHGELYRWIKGLGEFGYCRTRNVIEFIYEAVPELRAEWEAEKLTLIPVYHVDRNGRDKFTSLRLVKASSPA